MYCNVAAESTGRVLACRLYEATNDTGMKDMLAFNVARDTMHQQQWLAVIEELGPQAHLPMPNSWDQSKETQKYSYAFFGSAADGTPPMAGRWTAGPSLDGKGEFSVMQNVPMGPEPVLGPARKDSFAQKEQM